MRWLIAAGLALALAACTAGRAGPPTALPPVSIDPAAYRGFLVPAPLLPFRVEGVAQLTYRGERESGELSVQAAPGPRYQLELRARLTGGLALELRFDPGRMLVVDYVNETYLLAANTADTRLRLFDVDLTPEEFQTLLTGRVTRARFAAGGGVVRAATGEAVYDEAGARHRFWLNGDGLPREWVKEEHGVTVFQAEFRDYLALPQPDGSVLRLPRKVRLRGGNGSPGERPTVLAVGVRQFLPGAGVAVGAVDALPPGAAAFALGELPARTPR